MKILYALIAGLITFLITVLGSSLVFIFKKPNKNIMDSFISISAGIMLSASFFSLINPALKQSEELNMIPYIIVPFFILLGCILLSIGCKGKNKNLLLITSITLHNIPEGLAIGVAFGSIGKYSTLTSACLLALGIGIQNFPEGSAVSLPLIRSGYSKLKAFIIGGLSASVEPISAVIGALLVIKVKTLLPIFLSLAAGAMIYVVILELIPESQTNKHKKIMSILTIIGFCIMMFLDLAL